MKLAIDPPHRVSFFSFCTQPKWYNFVFIFTSYIISALPSKQAFPPFIPYITHHPRLERPKKKLFHHQKNGEANHCWKSERWVTTGTRGKVHEQRDDDVSQLIIKLQATSWVPSQWNLQRSFTTSLNDHPRRSPFFQVSFNPMQTIRVCVCVFIHMHVCIQLNIYWTAFLVSCMSVFWFIFEIWGCISHYIQPLVDCFH